MPITEKIERVLVPNWKEVLTKAWSVKFTLLSALLAAAEVALPIVQEQLQAAQLIPAGALAALAGIVSGANIIVRVLSQKESPL
jgi:hypothetical protein